jgi:asparagine synthase (glutamine-hydrolysing)
MCGIAGIINLSGINIKEISKMTSIISHRGPDDEGFLFTNNDKTVVAGGNDTPAAAWEAVGSYMPKIKVDDLKDFAPYLAFGHRRLSILDLSPSGHQPMCDKNERFWITFNGEIYNYLEIKEELRLLGHTFHTNTDTEVILSAYQEWGVECQNKFNGMWSFAIYDSVDKRIFISRDRFGIKPFYYTFSEDGSFYFASEIKQFTTKTDWIAVLNGARAYDYLYYALTDHTDETLFKGVNTLLPGHCYEGKLENLFKKELDGKINSKLWYKPNIKKFKGSFKDARNQFLEKFKESIRLHLRADVSVGSALSGGLDSSSIVSYINILLREEGKSEMQKTFSSCSQDERYDERKWMEEVVKETKVKGHYIYPKGKDVFNLTEKIVWHMDEPYQSQSAFLGYHVFKEAKLNNVIVLLNGQGADEYLSGYTEFKQLRQKNLLKKGKFNKLYNENRSLKSLIRIAVSVTFGNLPSKLKFKLANKKNEKLDNIINLSKIIKKRVHPYQLNNYQKTSHLEISNYQLNKEPLQKYLRWEDRNSMAHSVEARVPFLDYRLVELTHSFPLDYLDAPNESKRILVEAMKGILPEKVRQRKDKKGFITPEQNWFMKDFKEDFIDMLKSNLPYAKGIIKTDEAEKFYKKVQNGNIPFDYTYWHLLQFCIWMKVFNVQLEESI